MFTKKQTVGNWREAVDRVDRQILGKWGYPKHLMQTTENFYKRIKRYTEFK
jgi:hypothetical protein